MTSAAQDSGRPKSLLEFKLSETEVWWHEHYEWLKTCGYLLRSRYAPGWSPSWRGTNRSLWDSEDGRPARYAARLLDATRVSDGAYVVLKRVKQVDHPFEAEISQLFSSKSLSGEKDNHCVPIYEVLRIPEDEGTVLIVMPLLLPYAHAPFDTIGETVECFRQLFEGLLFMHKHRVAHRDFMTLNVMIDPTSFYVDAFHPVHPKMRRDFSGPARFKTRTEGRPKYIFIDFGLSRRYDSSVVDPKEPPIWGGDKEVPEFQNSNEPRNPFQTDVFYVGNMIKNDFLETMNGFDFMQSLIADMTQNDPSKRPTMQEVVDRFQLIRVGLSSWKLRSRVVDKEESLFDGVRQGILHWMQRICFIVKGIPAVPTPT